jgi:hypothetical protein
VRRTLVVPWWHIIIVTVNIAIESSAVCNWPVIAIPHMLSSHTFVYAAQILRCILFPWFINETREYDLETFKSSKRTRMICPEDIETRKLLRCQQSSTGVFGQSPTEAWISSSWLCLSVTLARGMRSPTSASSNCRYYSIAFCGVL